MFYYNFYLYYYYLLVGYVRWNFDRHVAKSEGKKYNTIPISRLDYYYIII